MKVSEILSRNLRKAHKKLSEIVLYEKGGKIKYKDFSVKFTNENVNDPINFIKDTVMGFTSQNNWNKHKLDINPLFKNDGVIQLLNKSIFTSGSTTTNGEISENFKNITDGINFNNIKLYEYKLRNYLKKKKNGGRCDRLIDKDKILVCLLLLNHIENDEATSKKVSKSGDLYNGENVRTDDGDTSSYSPSETGFGDEDSYEKEERKASRKKDELKTTPPATPPAKHSEHSTFTVSSFNLGTNEGIRAAKVALSKQDLSYEEAQKQMSIITEAKTQVSLRSQYWEKVKDSKIATEIKANVAKNRKTICSLFKGKDLETVDSFFTGDTDHDVSLCFLGAEGYGKEVDGSGGYAENIENRVGKRKAKLWKGEDKKLHTLTSASEDSLTARGIVAISETLNEVKELQKNFRDKNMYIDKIDANFVNKLADELLKLSSYHCCSFKTLGNVIKSGGLKSLYDLQHPYFNLSKPEFIQTVWNETKINEEYDGQREQFKKFIDEIIKDNKEKEMDLICHYYYKIYKHNFSALVIAGVPIDSLKSKSRDLDAYQAEPPNPDEFDTTYIPLFAYLKSIIEKGEKDNQPINEWRKPESDSSDAIGAQKDIKLLSFQTVFSIFGGNLKANTIYGGPTNKAIVKIPIGCLSYLTPYSEIFNINQQAYQRLGENFPKNVTIANSGNYNGDDRALNGIIPKKYYYDKENNYVKEPKSNRLSMNNNACRVSLALDMSFKYAILTGKNPFTAKIIDILKTYYEEVGSHACIEGHSPSNIPFGRGGIEEILLIGNKSKDMLSTADLLRTKGVKCAIIEKVPQTYKEFIASWKKCE